MTASWIERIWSGGLIADIGRGRVTHAVPFNVYGQNTAAGAVDDQVLWETGMPQTLTVPNGIRLSLVSTLAGGTQRIKLHYLDGDLLYRTETVQLAGTTPVLTAATDIRAINMMYSLDGPVVGTISATSGGTTYALIGAGTTAFNTSMVRVPANRRLLITSLYAGASSGSAAASVVVKFEGAFINGDSFADEGYFHPMGAIAVQDSAVTMAGFGVMVVPPGEWIGLTFSTDKAAQVVGGMFGALEPV